MRLPDRWSLSNPRLRIASAIVWTLMVFVAVTSIGGVGTAASAAHKGVRSVSYLFSSEATTGRGDDFDPADDQQVKPCEDALKQRIKVEQEQHKGALLVAQTEQERQSENARNEATLNALREQKQRC